MSTPLRASSLRTTYRAIACATVRAFAKVKSSAMTPRQPSVPNRIEVIAGEYTRCELFAKSRIGLLEEVFPALLLEPLHEFGHVLGTVAGANEQRIGRLDDDEITYADGGDELFGAVKEVAGGVESVAGACEDIFAEFLCE